MQNRWRAMQSSAITITLTIQIVQCAVMIFGANTIIGPELSCCRIMIMLSFRLKGTGGAVAPPPPACTALFHVFECTFPTFVNWIVMHHTTTYTAVSYMLWWARLVAPAKLVGMWVYRKLWEGFYLICRTGTTMGVPNISEEVLPESVVRKKKKSIVRNKSKLLAIASGICFSSFL